MLFRAIGLCRHDLGQASDIIRKVTRMSVETLPQMAPATAKHDADYVFFELTRSLCPTCRRVVDAHILFRDNQVFMRKRCPEHGVFEARVYGDAAACTDSARVYKPGTIPLQFS